jgi:hypothetical protein
MDLLAETYKCQARLFKDRPDVLVDGQWHLCPPGAIPYPGFHAFGAVNWDSNEFDQVEPSIGMARPKLGMVPRVPEPGYSGTRWCGSPDAWLHGDLYAQRGSLALDSRGRPACCQCVDAGEVRIGGSASIEGETRVILRIQALVLVPGTSYYPAKLSTWSDALQAWDDNGADCYFVLAAGVTLVQRYLVTLVDVHTDGLLVYATDAASPLPGGPDGYVLVRDAAALYGVQWVSPGTVLSDLTGDVSVDGFGVATVIGINGWPIDNAFISPVAPPGSNPILYYNSGTHQWEAGIPALGIGDLAWDFWPTSNQVIGIQTRPVDPSIPAVGDMLQWSGAVWAVAGGITGGTPLGNFYGGRLTSLVASGPWPVSGGGTGLVAVTPYAIICGGTLPSSALQQVAGLGVAGQVLTSAGAGALPTWAAAPGTPSPLTTKGDVWGYAAIDARIPVGTDGQVLTADSTTALGVSWQARLALGDLIAGGGTNAVLFVDAGGLLQVDSTGMSYQGAGLLELSDGGAHQVRMCATYTVEVTQGSVSVQGVAANTYRWGASATAPATQALLALPLNVFGAGAVTSVLGTPDAWVEIDVAGTRYKIPAYLL